MQTFTFGVSDYIIEIFADTHAEALKAWEQLQERNYYPTGRKWYCSTDSCESPAQRQRNQQQQWNDCSPNEVKRKFEFEIMRIKLAKGKILDELKMLDIELKVYQEAYNRQG